MLWFMKHHYCHCINYMILHTILNILMWISSTTIQSRARVILIENMWILWIFYSYYIYVHNNKTDKIIFRIFRIFWKNVCISTNFLLIYSEERDHQQLAASYFECKSPLNNNSSPNKICCCWVLWLLWWQYVGQTLIKCLIMCYFEQ